MYFDFEMKNLMKIYIISIFIFFYILIKVIVLYICICLLDLFDFDGMRYYFWGLDNWFKYDFLYILCYEVEIR